MSSLDPVLLSTPVRRTLLRLTLPMVWGLVIVKAFNLIDMYFISRLGTEAMAANSFVFPLLLAYTNLAVGLGVGASSLVARAIGSRDSALARVSATASLLLATLSMGFLALLCWVGLPAFFRWQGATAEHMALIEPFLAVWLPGGWLLAITIVIYSLFRASGDMFWPSAIMTLVALLNMALDPLLIFGYGPLSPLGLTGAAFASSLAQLAGFITALFFLIRRRHLLVFTAPERALWVKHARNVARIGLPVALGNMIVPASASLIIGLAASFGSAAIAGIGIANRIESFALILLVSLASGLNPFIGQNWGAGENVRVRQAIRIAYGFCISGGIFLTALLAGLAEPLAHLFTQDAAVSTHTVAFLTIVPWSHAAVGITLVAGATFNALGLSIRSFLLTLLRWLVLYIPLAWLARLSYGLEGIFYANLVANLLTALLALLWLHYSMKRLPVTHLSAHRL